MQDESQPSFSAVKARLDAVLEAVNDRETPLEEALALCEEAVELGLAASDRLEADVAGEDGQAQADGAQAPEGPQASSEPQGPAGLQVLADEQEPAGSRALADE